MKKMFHWKNVTSLLWVLPIAFCAVTILTSCSDAESDAEGGTREEQAANVAILPNLMASHNILCNTMFDSRVAFVFDGLEHIIIRLDESIKRWLPEGVKVEGYQLKQGALKSNLVGKTDRNYYRNIVDGYRLPVDGVLKDISFDNNK